MRQYYVYNLASRSRTLYVGVTNDIGRRIAEHRMHANPGFTTRYKVERLVYVEATDHVGAAIAREKQIKAWRREKKVALIESMNPAWDDLADGWDDAELPIPQYRAPRSPRPPKCRSLTALGMTGGAAGSQGAAGLQGAAG